MTTATASLTYAPTAQQAAFLQALTDTPNHLTLLARAGCGKTSAILMGVDAYTEKFPSSDILVCAYNKAIAEEVSAKLKARGHNDWRKVQASTLHALGFGLVRFAFSPKVDDKKVLNLIDSRAISQNTYSIYRSQINSLVQYAKQAGFGFFGDLAIGDSSAWYSLADHFDVNGFEDTSDMDEVVFCAQQIYRDSLAETSIIDYDDMILFSLIKSLKVKFTKDVIFLDEAQDLSRARQALARKFLKPRTGRMIVVGDDRQAIYGFSGADSAALDNLTRDLNATVLPLSVTWRCPKSVVSLAQNLVPDLQAAESAIDGEVLYSEELPSDLNFNDAILCRNTAPLIEIAYKLIRSGKACKVEGRKIGEGLINLAQRWKVSSTDVLYRKLEDYRDREVQKALAKGQEQKAEDVTDKVETLFQIIKAVNFRAKYQVRDVVDFINSLFEDGADNVITLATYHRSKGREWDRVFLFEHKERCPSRAAKQQWQIQQESNLAYVAITRAKRVLGFVR